MSSKVEAESNDFEIVASPDNESDPIPETQHETTTDGDPPRRERKSIRNLFDTPKGPLLVQHLAKTLFFAALPILMAWSVVVALIITVYPSPLDDGTPFDEKVLRQLQKSTYERLNQCHKCLFWINDDLPSVLER